jgi:hypothetical protein
MWWPNVADHLGALEIFAYHGQPTPARICHYPCVDWTLGPVAM